MFCKMSMSLLGIAFLFLILVADGEAQLNFSTGWGQGKRSQDMRIRSSNMDCSPQGASLEQLLKLYSFIQMEAQRILDCQTLNK
ncbi:PREDICTED: hypertrehalosaemic prohormone-like [Trachymyrmex cornetzi]|uniref:hypertrehalosaemic prohormone-like n=1 Tax=Trachymyrmex cornetzi TaxID=471704 RepID=UPI00084F0E02|nr:PREDICTED: hypertrehalosaemic prohormone-like [Trachymyrmex cornetzi]